MATKIECDSCGRQFDASTDRDSDGYYRDVQPSIVRFTLPAIPYNRLTQTYKQRPARTLDLCLPCGERVHAAADPLTREAPNKG